MVRKGWKNIALPEEIVDMIDKVIKNSKYGFRSRAGFVLEAVKSELKKFGYYP
jgi:metal-responsive CopG/Arc/MetJ family transcriptional regulator